jgi:hypothetical protein
MRQPANKNEGVPAVVLHGLVRRKAGAEEAYETALENWQHAWATGTNEEKRKAITALEKAQNEYENFPPAQSRKHPSETVGASKDGALVKPFTPNADSSQPAPKI